MVGCSGGISGFFGLPALGIELPITTTIIMRSIVDIVKSEGESIENLETKLACLEVFALGGRSDLDDPGKSAYFTVRSALANLVAESADFIAKKTLADEGKSALIKFVSKIAEKFSIQLSENVLAKALPIIGSASGAIINTVFINHFQELASGHFAIRRLEIIYGEVIIRKRYQEIKYTFQ